MRRPDKQLRSVARTERRTRRVANAVLVLCLALPTLSSARRQIIERVVAVVDDEIILLSQVNQRIAPLVQRLEQIPDEGLRRQRLAELQKQALDQLIGEELIVLQARKLKLEISDNDLERAVAEVMQKNNLSREQLAAALQREGKTLAEYKTQMLRPQLLRLKVLNVTVRNRVSVSEDEIKALYQKNLRDLGVEEKVRARHIFFAVEDWSSKKHVEAAKQRAEHVLKQIASGSDFAKLAQERSDDAVTKSDGGDLGFFSRGSLPAALEREVFQMKKGETRGPLRGERGLHVIQLTDRQASSARPFAEVQSTLRNQIYSQKMEKATEAWLSELRKRSHVEIK
ncbi:MAG: peptidylprolyl isomerase [Deltaproteobacteria bacterium]|nr:peptidylprolyl isomerase [Deltaproteobacteria bacterium]